MPGEEGPRSPTLSDGGRDDQAPVIEVTTRDLETGETETKQVCAGDYVLVTTWPLALEHVAVYASGTRVLTLKKQKGDPDGSNED